MEKDNEVTNQEGTSYTTYFRQYDPRVSRWLSIDPKQSAWESPYTSMANNPVMNMDPLGDTVKFAGTKEKEHYTDYKNEVAGRISSAQKTMAQIDQQLKSNDLKAGKVKKLNKQREKAQNKYDLYSGIVKELVVLENSTDVFRIRYGSNISNSSGDGNVSFNSQTMEIDVNISDGYEGFSVIQKLSHELTHAYQFTQGKLSLTPDGGGGDYYDRVDEYEAFRRQNLFYSTYAGGGKYLDDVEGYVDNNPSYFHLPKESRTIFNDQFFDEKSLIQIENVYWKRNDLPPQMIRGYHQRYMATQKK